MGGAEGSLIPSWSYQRMFDNSPSDNRVLSHHQPPHAYFSPHSVTSLSNRLSKYQLA